MIAQVLTQTQEDCCGVCGKELAPVGRIPNGAGWFYGRQYAWDGKTHTLIRARCQAHLPGLHSEENAWTAYAVPKQAQSPEPVTVNAGGVTLALTPKQAAEVYSQLKQALYPIPAAQADEL